MAGETKNRKNNAAEKRKMMVRILAIVLVVVMFGSCVFVYVISALADSQAPEANTCELEMSVMEQEEALQITQRLVYINRTDVTIDRVVFNVPANLYRSESSLPYEGDTLSEAFSEGYTPGGIAILSLAVDGESAEWGMTDTAQTHLSVSVDLAPGEKCVFEMAYILLLSRNSGFCGISDGSWFLSGFFLSPAPYTGTGDALESDYCANTNWLAMDETDFVISCVLPEGFSLIGPGECAKEEDTDKWVCTTSSVRDLAICLFKDGKTVERTSEGGQTVRVTGKKEFGDIADEAARMLSMLEKYFGKAQEEISIVILPSAEKMAAFPGLIRLDEGEADGIAIRRAVAKQYFSFVAFAEPVNCSWIGDTVSIYLAYMLTEEESGWEDMIAELDEDVLPTMKYTIPGNLYVTTSANVMSQDEYEEVVLGRGCIAMHELRLAMGKDSFLEALRNYLAMEGDILDEDDFAAALNATGDGKTTWDRFLADWIYNMNDYVDTSLGTLG